MSQRTRLTTKTAAEAEDAYTLNEARPAEDKRGGNGSGEAFNKEYDITNGEKYPWGDEPVSEADTAKLHKEDVEKRDEMNIGEIRYAFSQAIKNTKSLEERAAKALIASERMLPGADAKTIEANAMDLMFMPPLAIDGLLARQAALAESIAADCKDEEKEEEKEAATEEAPAEEAPAEGDKEAPAEAEATVIPEEEDKLAAMNAKIDKLAELVMAMAKGKEEAPADPVVEETAEEVETPEADVTEEEETPVEASSKTASEDSLDSIFSAVETGSTKAGASRLSGMVRQASDAGSDDGLGDLWGDTPDVSSVFQ